MVYTEFLVSCEARVYPSGLGGLFYVLAVCVEDVRVTGEAANVSFYKAGEEAKKKVCSGCPKWKNVPKEPIEEVQT